MKDDQINTLIKEFTGIDADFLADRHAQDKAHSIMAFKTCGENATPEQQDIWDEYGYHLFKDGCRRIDELSDHQWAEAYLRALDKWEEEK